MGLVKIFAVGQIGLSLLVGCSSYEARPPPSLAADPMARREVVQKSGVTLMAKVVNEKKELEDYYGADLIRSGVLPVEINVRVDSAAEAQRRAEGGLALRDARGSHLPPLDLEQVMDKAGLSYWGAAGRAVVFGPVGAVVSAVRVSRSNEEMREDYQRRILPDEWLRPGKSVSGVAFFEIPEDIESLDGWRLEVRLISKQGTKIALLYPLSGPIK